LLDIHASDSEEEMVAIGAGQYRRKSQGPESEVLEDDEDTMPANGQSKRRRAD
ncbi:hypothetical protein KCU73_g16943, partial [Aureobasidium melanogenum]